jgi:hypothetical protein
MAAGAKPAALVTHEKLAAKPYIKPVVLPITPKKIAAKPLAKAKSPKTAHKIVAKRAKYGPPKKWMKHPAPAVHATVHKSPAGPAKQETLAAKKKPSPAIAKANGSEANQ